MPPDFALGVLSLLETTVDRVGIGGEGAAACSLAHRRLDFISADATCTFCETGPPAILTRSSVHDVQQAVASRLRSWSSGPRDGVGRFGSCTLYGGSKSLPRGYAGDNDEGEKQCVLHSGETIFILPQSIQAVRLLMRLCRSVTRWRDPFGAEQVPGGRSVCPPARTSSQGAPEVPSPRSSGSALHCSIRAHCILSRVNPNPHSATNRL